MRVWGLAARGGERGRGRAHWVLAMSLRVGRERCVDVKAGCTYVRGILDSACVRYAAVALISSWVGADVALPRVSDQSWCAVGVDTGWEDERGRELGGRAWVVRVWRGVGVGGRAKLVSVRRCIGGRHVDVTGGSGHRHGCL